MKANNTVVVYWGQREANQGEEKSRDYILSELWHVTVQRRKLCLGCYEVSASCLTLKLRLSHKILRGARKKAYTMAEANRSRRLGSHCFDRSVMAKNANNINSYPQYRKFPSQGNTGESNEVRSCQLCANVRQDHSYSRPMIKEFQCPISGCFKLYKRQRLLKGHISECHPQRWHTI